MPSGLRSLLHEVELQIDLDQKRGAPPLAVRAKALTAVRTSATAGPSDRRLIDLAAACLAFAARLPALTPR